MLLFTYLYFSLTLLIVNFLLKDQDAVAEPNNTRRKRLRTTTEDDLVAAKLRHDMELQHKQFALDAEIRRAQSTNEAKRIEVELLREERLAKEAARSEEIYKNMQTTLNIVLGMLQNKSS